MIERFLGYHHETQQLGENIASILHVSSQLMFDDYHCFRDTDIDFERAFHIISHCMPYYCPSLLNVYASHSPKPHA